MGLEKYPLLTQKAADFILFKQVLDLIKEKDNLSIEGISKIINIKASMNLGISETQKSNFSLTLWADAVVKKAEVLINPVVRPVIITNNIFDPNWISGFTSAEGCFDVSFRKSLNPKVKKYVTLRFRIYQHERDRNLMELLIKYLGSGKIEKHSKNPVVNLTIGKFSDINNVIIPFFEKYPLNGTKQLEFTDWLKIAKLINERSHLTPEGLDQINKLKAGMNRGRYLTKF